MAENLNPITGLPEDDKRNSIKKSVLKPVQRSGSSIDQSRISPMADLVKPVDIAETIPEKAPSLKKQLVTGEDFKAGVDYRDILDKYDANLNTARNNYLKKLDEDQAWYESYSNAIMKFTGKIAARVGLGLLGTATDLGKLIIGQNPLEKNIFQEWEEQAVEALDRNLPIYSDNPDYHQLGFMEKLFTEPGKMFGDEIGDAISFMGSAILQEVILSAATAASMGAAAPLQASASIRLGKQALAMAKKGFNTIPKLLKSKQAAKAFKYTDEIAETLDATGDIAKAENLLHMGASVPGLAGLVHYEAGIEANGTYDAMMQTFEQQFIEEHGVAPTEQQKREAEKVAADARAATYGINAAILLPSHLIQFGSAFKKMYGASKNLSKASGQIIKKGTEYTTKHAAKSKAGKLLTYTGLVLKNPITEAGEEFMQGVANEGNLEYFSRYYSPEAHRESLSYLSSMAKSGVDYFNSTEGGNSMGIGALVGLLGLPLPKKLGGYSGGVIGDIKEYNKNRKLAEQLIEANKLNDGTLNNILQHNYQNYVTASTIGQDMEAAAQAGDAFEYKNLEHDNLFSYLYNRVTLGLTDDIIDDINSAKEMSLEEFNKSWVGESHKPLTEQEKSATLEKLTNTVKNIQKYSEAADNIIEYNSRRSKKDGEALRALGDKVKPFLVHAASTLTNLDTREQELVNKLTEISSLSETEIEMLKDESKHNKALNRLMVLAKKEKSGKELSEKEKTEMEEIRKVVKINAKALRDLYQNETQDIDLNMLRSISGAMTELSEGVDQTDFLAAAEARLDAAINSTENKINKAEIMETIEDLAKVKNRRESFGKFYDYLATPEGLEALGKVAEQAEENLAETVQHTREEKAKEKAATAKTPAEKQAAKDFAEEQGEDIANTIKKQEQDQASEQSINAHKVKNVTFNDLMSRYGDNMELYNQEVKALNEKLREIGAAFNSSALEDPVDFIADLIDEYDSRKDVRQVVDEFFAELNNRVDAKREQQGYDPSGKTDDVEVENEDEGNKENQQGFESTETEEEENDIVTVDAYRTKNTPSSRLNYARRGAGMYYALDKPFQEAGTEDSDVIKVTITYKKSETLDATTKEGQKEFEEIREKALGGKTFKSDEEKNKALSNAMREVWKIAKSEAKKQNKILMVSDMIFLKENQSDFDKVINVPSNVFINRATKRGDNKENLQSWKNNIDQTLKNVDSKKIVTTDKYLSDLFQPDVEEEIIKSTDKIIWGHPGIGKTTAKQENDFFDFDTDFKPLVAQKLGLPKSQQNSIGLNEWRKTGNEEDFKNAMREAGYSSLIGFIEEDNQNAGRELVKYAAISKQDTNKDTSPNQSRPIKKTSIFSDVNTVGDLEYELEKRNEAGIYHVKRDENNQPVKAPKFNKNSENDTDFDYVNGSNIHIGDTLYLRVDKSEHNDDYHNKNKSIFNDIFRVFVVHKDSAGAEHIVGTLPRYQQVEYERASEEAKNRALRELRDALLEEMDSKKGTVFNSRYTLKVSGTGHGKIFHTDNFMSVKEATGKKPIFGIVRTVNGQKTLSFPNFNGEVRNVNQKYLKSGAVYIADQNPDGSYTAIPAQTRELNDEDYQKVESLLNIMSQNPDTVESKKARRDIKDIVFVDLYTRENQDGSVVFNIKEPNRYIDGLTTEDVIEYLKGLNKKVQIDYDKLNTGNYNEEIDGDKVKIDLNPNQYRHSKTVHFESFAKDNPNSEVADETTEVKPEPTEQTPPKPEKSTPTDKDVTVEKTPRPPKPRRRGGRKGGGAGLSGNSDALFKFATDETRKWDKKRSLEWLSKNLPNVPVSVVDDISTIAETGGRLAWGVFKDSVIYLANQAGRGTAYHEAFHAVFWLSLNDNQRLKMLQEAQVQTGLTNDIELEEWLADKFEQFTLENFIEASIGAKIKNFFNKLLNWINIFKSKDASTIEELFTNINYGVYSKTKVNPEVAGITRWKLAQFTAAEKVERLDMLNNFFLNILDSKLSIAGPQGSVKDVLNNYRYFPRYVSKVDTPYEGIEAFYVDIYENDLQDLHDALQIIVDSGYDAKKVKEHPDYNEFSPAIFNTYLGRTQKDINYALNQIDMVMDEFFTNGVFTPGNLLKEASYGLRKYGIKINISKVKNQESSGELSKNLDDRQLSMLEGLKDNAGTEDAENFESWQFDRAETSLKDTTSFYLRHELSKFKDVRVVNGKKTVNTDSIGFEKKLDFDTVFNDLKHDLSSLSTLEDMLEVLKAKAKFKPYYTQIIDKLESTQGDYLQFRSAFFHTMATSKINYALQLISSEEKEGITEFQYNIIESNRKSPDKIVRQEWNSMFIYNTNNNIIKPSDAKKYSDEINDIIKAIEVLKPSELDSKDALKISNRLNKIGIGLTAQDLISSYSNNKANFISMFVGKGKNPGILNAVYGAIAKGSNPFVIGKGGETTALKPFLNIAINTRRNLYESSFMNVDNKQVFSSMVPNFMQRLVSNLSGTKYEDVINEYRKDPFFKNNLWLKELEENPDLRDSFKMYLLDGRKVQGEKRGKKYTKLSPRERFITELVFFNNEDTNGKEGKLAKYVMPILADAPQMPLISFKKYSNEEVIEHFYQIALTERARIERVKKEQSEEGYPLIENYHIFKGSKEDALGLKYHFVPDMSDIDPELNKAEAVKRITDMLEKESDKLKANAVELGINGTYDTIELPKSIGNVNSFMKNYAYNQTLANANMTMIFAGDIPYYKSQTDISKRNKQASNPGQLLDESVTGKSYSTLYLKDIEITSNFVDVYERVLEGSPHKDAIIAQYKLKEDKGVEGVNTTDAQSFISLDRWKKVMKGSGVWDKTYDAVFDRLKSGEGTLEDIAIVAQPIKPFYYGMEYSPKHKKYLPTQNKNSEYVVFPQMLNTIPEGKREKFETILNLLSGPNALDSIQFESAVKVGGNRITDFNDLVNNPEAITKAQTENRIELLNRNYRIQLNVPEHHIDSTILFPTQIRKAVLSNIDLNAEYTVDGKTMTGREMFDKYQTANTMSLEQDFKELEAIFKDKEKLRELLEDEILDRGLSEKYLKAIELEGDKFKFPLWFPLSAKRNESLLSSLFRNRVTKQKIKGGSFVQVSDFFYSDHLKVTTKEVTYKDSEGNSQTKEVIDTMEAILPWWTKKYMPLDENGLVDVNKIPQELRELVSLRIPTEDKYSFPIIKVVGFSPKTAGGTAILPADITRRAGTDFDVDKLFIMMPEFDVSTDFNKILEEVKLLPEANGFSDATLEQIIKGNATAAKYDLEARREEQVDKLILEGVSDEEIDNIHDAYDAGIELIEAIQEKIKTIKPKYQSLSKVKSQHDSKDKASRNNFLIDTIKGVLQHPLHQEEALTPGSFDTLKKLKEDILKVYNKSSEDINFILPSSQLELFKRNMAARDLIGIFANHLSNHNVVQHTNIGLVSPIKVKFKNASNVTSLFSLSNTKNQEGGLISRTISEFVAASVDNAKDPVLSDLNISPFTANIAALMVRVGIPLPQVVSYLNQPAILELSKRVENGENYFTVLDDLISQYEGKSKYKTKGDYYLDFNLLKNSLLPKEKIQNLSEQALIDHSTNQFIALNAFGNLFDKANALDKLVRASKADAVGSKTLSENQLFIDNVNDLLAKDTMLTGVSELLEGEQYPFIKKSYEYGIKKPNEILGEYFPWESGSFRVVKDLLEKLKGDKKLTERESEFVNYNILTYLAADFDFFKISKEELFNLSVNFPLEFKNAVAEDPDLQSNPFVEAVYYESAENNKEGIGRLITNNTGSLEPLQQWAIENGFMELFNSTKYKSLAENLIRYSFFNNGFNYGPVSYNHLLPLTPYESIVDENGNTLMEYLEKNLERFDEDDFIIKFAQNYPDKYAYFQKTSMGDLAKNSAEYYSDQGKNKIGSFITSFIVDSSQPQLIEKDLIVSSFRGKTYLYKKAKTTDNAALFTLINTTGKENYFVQYSRDIQGADFSINAKFIPEMQFKEKIGENKYRLHKKMYLPDGSGYLSMGAKLSKDIGFKMMASEIDLFAVQEEYEKKNKKPSSEEIYQDYAREVGENAPNAPAKLLGKNLDKSNNIPIFAQSVENLKNASIEDFTLALIETNYIMADMDWTQSRPDLDMKNKDLTQAIEKIKSGDVMNRLNEVYASVTQLYNKLEEIRSEGTEFPMIQGTGGNSVRTHSPKLDDFLQEVVTSYKDLGKENDSEEEFCLKG